MYVYIYIYIGALDACRDELRDSRDLCTGLAALAPDSLLLLLLLLFLLLFYYYCYNTFTLLLLLLLLTHFYLAKADLAAARGLEDAARDGRLERLEEQVSGLWNCALGPPGASAAKPQAHGADRGEAFGQPAVEVPWRAVEARDRCEAAAEALRRASPPSGQPPPLQYGQPPAATMGPQQAPVWASQPPQQLQGATPLSTPVPTYRSVAWAGASPWHLAASTPLTLPLTTGQARLTIQVQ